MERLTLDLMGNGYESQFLDNNDHTFDHRAAIQQDVSLVKKTNLSIFFVSACTVPHLLKTFRSLWSSVSILSSEGNREIDWTMYIHKTDHRADV